MTRLAIIGGTGLDRIPGLQIKRREVSHTPFGEPSGALLFGELAGKELVFLPRHGFSHNTPPHKVNYRANIWALGHAGATSVIGVAAVGGISDEMEPGIIVVPDQIIDYTYGREHSLFETDLSHVTHIDFTNPYCDELRQHLLDAATRKEINAVTTGTYGATQGPRLETAMEINRLQQDGCDIVGMTGMPEAALARELGLCYACCAVVANWAAGKQDGPITMEKIEQNLQIGMKQVKELIGEILESV